jgi:hypothetical protein
MPTVKQTKAARAREGDIFRIPLPSGASGIAKVLYVSKRYRNVMLLGVAAGADISEVAAVEADFSAGLFYTSVEAPAYLGWHCIASTPVSFAESQLSRRIVGGEVWLGDVEIGPASSDDRRKLPRMLALGGGILKKKIYELVDCAV